MSAGEALLAELPPVTFIVGKGGVGKTTCASALALAAARTAPARLVTTDPAHALPAVLGVPVGSDDTPAPYAPGLTARMLDAPALRARFMARWGSVLKVILDRGTYLDDADIAPLVDTALPGGDEIFAALELAALLSHAEPGETSARLFVDTAPTGHTLRLLSLPQTFDALVRLLDAMQEKHRFMVRTLTRAYRADSADEFIAAMRRDVGTLRDTLRDPARCAAVMVANDDPVVLAETRRYLSALRDLGMDARAVVWNASPPAAIEVRSAFVVPRLPSPAVGEQGLAAWFAAIARASSGPAHRAPARGNRSAAHAAPGVMPITADWLPPLTIVGGKGGVGKTTVACALALQAAERFETLLASTDPAPSLADAFGQDIPDADTPVAGVARLRARQMDATAAFERLRAEYTARVDALFESLVDRGVRLTADRAITRDLLALAPPGVDEVYALTVLADALESGRYERIVVDPAPTGHLLRLLEMPQLALSWTHQLMRLMLRYKEVAGLGETARELLDLARSLRGVDALLRDPARAGLVIVTLDEPVVRGETERLSRAVTGLRVAVRAVVHNRQEGTALPVEGVDVQVVAPASPHMLVGHEAIRRWSATWLPVPPNGA